MSRVVSLVVALLVVLTAAVTLVPGARAQTTGTLTLNLVTCTIPVPADPIPSIEITPTFDANGRACVSKWQPRRATTPHFTLNGIPSDGGDGTTTVSWSGLAPGTDYTVENTADSGYMEPYTFTLPASGAITLTAVYDDFYLSTPSTTGLTEEQLTGNTVMVTDDVTLRATPDYGGARLAVVPAGSVVTLRIEQVDTVVDSSGARWWPVAFNGQDGWIDGQYLAPGTGNDTGGTNPSGPVSSLPNTGSGATRSHGRPETTLFFSVMAILLLGGAWFTVKRRSA